MLKLMNVSLRRRNAAVLLPLAALRSLALSIASLTISDHVRCDVGDARCVVVMVASGAAAPADAVLAALAAPGCLVVGVVEWQSPPS